MHCGQCRHQVLKSSPLVCHRTPLPLLNSFKMVSTQVIKMDTAEPERSPFLFLSLCLRYPQCNLDTEWHHWSHIHWTPDSLQPVSFLVQDLYLKIDMLTGVCVAVGWFVCVQGRRCSCRMQMTVGKDPQGWWSPPQQPTWGRGIRTVTGRLSGSTIKNPIMHWGLRALQGALRAALQVSCLTWPQSRTVKLHL